MPDKTPEERSSGRRESESVVDDDREIVESMRLALEASGYEIMVARDGNQGLAMAERDNPDLVILDMMMPKTQRISGAGEAPPQSARSPAGHHDHRQ